MTVYEDCGSKEDGVKSDFIIELVIESDKAIVAGTANGMLNTVLRALLSA